LPAVHAPDWSFCRQQAIARRSERP
jgi:hypothetical protein